jgi:hypothetical protein
MRRHFDICLDGLFFSLALQPPWALASAFSFMIIFTDGRTPWTGDQLVGRPLPKHRTTQTQNKRIYIPNIHALCGIRTHGPSFRAREGSSSLRPLGYCNRRLNGLRLVNLSLCLTNSALRHEGVWGGGGGLDGLKELF